MKDFLVALCFATFTKNGLPFLPYIYLFMFLMLVMVMYVMKLAGASHISDALVRDSFAVVAIWSGILIANNTAEKFFNRFSERRKKKNEK